MKIKGSKKVHYESGPDMTPLVDVVMVILIFLMLVGKFGDSKIYLVSTSPIAEGGGGKQLDPGKIPDQPLDITVSSAPPYDTFVAYAGQIRTSDPAVLTAQLKQMTDALVATGKKPEDIQVYIKPAPDTPYKHLIAVYQASLEAGLQKVGFGRTS